MPSSGSFDAPPHRWFLEPYVDPLGCLSLMVSHVRHPHRSRARTCILYWWQSLRWCCLWETFVGPTFRPHCLAVTFNLDHDLLGVVPTGLLAMIPIGMVDYGYLYFYVCSVTCLKYLPKLYIHFTCRFWYIIYQVNNINRTSRLLHFCDRAGPSCFWITTWMLAVT